MVDSMRKIPLSGGPHSGKTTLFRALQERYPDAYFIPEPATEIIEHEQSLKLADDSHVLNVPWLDYKRFGPTVMKKSVELESQIPLDADLVFQDRSLIDTIAYARLNNFDNLVPQVQRRVAAANYAFAFFCEPVGEYAMTHVRQETSNEALLTHDYLRRAYDESGIPIVELPNIPVADRLTIVHRVITEFS
jgi:predicted ATPase